MTLTTTLNAIGTSPARMEKLLSHLGKTEADDEPVTLAEILRSNGLLYAVWCLRTQTASVAAEFAERCAQRVAHLENSNAKAAAHAAAHAANATTTSAAAAAAYYAAAYAARSFADAAAAAAERKAQEELFIKLVS